MKTADFNTDLACLEIGSGIGSFLSYLAYKGRQEFQGIDHDDALVDVQPTEVAGHLDCADVWQYLEDCGSKTYDRVVILDVLEHFSTEEGFYLLTRIKSVLGDQGKIIVRVPNASSPWGLSYQFSDLTHKTPYNPESLRQLAIACGLGNCSIYEQRQGSRRSMITDAIINKFLSWTLLTPPSLWGANIYGVLSKTGIS